MINARICRDSATAPACLIINDLNEPWRLFAGAPVIDYAKPFMVGRGSGIFALKLPAHKRFYFSLQTKTGQIMLAEKKLPLQGAYNFRDMGGLFNGEGQQVVWGKLVRADDMMDLTEQDLQYLASMPLSSVVDFRTPEEISWAPDRKPSGLKNYYQYHVVPGGISAACLEMGGAMDANQFMCHIYRHLVLDETLVEVYAKFFQLLQREEQLPLLFHCSAGKDRTGWAAALILFALGVDEQTIMQDYLLSAQYIKGKYPADNERFTVKAQYLQTAIDQARGSYGSMDSFLTKALRVDIGLLRAMYLQ